MTLAKTRTLLLVSMTAAWLLVTACSQQGIAPPAEGEEGGACFSNGGCNSGLVCSTMNTCFRLRDGMSSGLDMGIWSGISNDESDKCPCESGRTRCNGNKAQVCRYKQWTTEKTCEAPQVCVFGECVVRTNECPTEGRYDDNHNVISEEYAPIVVSECLSGGDSGQEVTATPTPPESHARTLAVSIGFFNCGNETTGMNFEAVFDIPVGTPSATPDEPRKFFLNAGEFGVLYRQTVRVARPASLWKGDKYFGTAVLYDWEYIFDFVKGTSCPTIAKLPTTPPIGALSCLTAENKCVCM